MAKASLNNRGFIPMLLSILAAVLFVIFIIFTRVMHAKH
jgi:hypothetical protein